MIKIIASDITAAATYEVTSKDYTHPAATMLMNPGAHRSDKIIDYGKLVGRNMYAANVMPPLQTMWDQSEGNTLELTNMILMRVNKSGWSIG